MRKRLRADFAAAVVAAAIRKLPMRIASRRPWAVTVSLLVITSTAIVGFGNPPSAHASGTCFWSQGYCMDDWGNDPAGSDLVMYDPLNANENFSEEAVGRCGGTVNEFTNCPFNNPVFNRRYNGSTIFQIRYNGTNRCVAWDGEADGRAVLGTCNDADGFNGSTGTIFIEHDSGVAFNFYAINLYWSNAGGYGNNAACMVNYAEDGGVGPTVGQIYLNLPTNDGCPTWAQTSE